MRNLTYCIIIVVLFSCGQSQQQTSQSAGSATTTGIDTALATQLGADSFGYKMYTLVIYRPGLKLNDSSFAGQLLGQHLKYLKSPLDTGGAIMLGPVPEEQSPISGICIFNMADTAKAKALAEGDPAVKTGDLQAEAHIWYGPAALQKLPELHKKLAAKSFADR